MEYVQAEVAKNRASCSQEHLKEASSPGKATPSFSRRKFTAIKIKDMASTLSASPRKTGSSLVEEMAKSTS